MLAVALRGAATLALIATVGCQGVPTTPPQPEPEISDEEPLEILDRYLLAYRQVLAEYSGKGMPTWETWESALDGGDPEYVRMANNVMDALFGFDFVRPLALDPSYCSIRPYDQTVAGSFRIGKADLSVELELLDSFRAGLRAAIDGGDKLAEMVRLMELHHRKWNYHPMHSGRCYPHGHETADGTPNFPYPNPAWCIVDQAQRLVPALAAKRTGPAYEPLSFGGDCDCYYWWDCGDHEQWECDRTAGTCEINYNHPDPRQEKSDQAPADGKCVRRNTSGDDDGDDGGGSGSTDRGQCIWCCPICFLWCDGCDDGGGGGGLE